MYTVWSAKTHLKSNDKRSGWTRIKICAAIEGVEVEGPMHSRPYDNKYDMKRLKRETTSPPADCPCNSHMQLI
jgi:hypothetical protein